MKRFNEELLEWRDIYDYVNEMIDTFQRHKDIYSCEDEMWSIIYDMVFSEKINGRLQEIYPFDWFDPDASYEDDVRSWLSGLDECYEKRIRILLETNDRIDPDYDY